MFDTTGKTDESEITIAGATQLDEYSLPILATKIAVPRHRSDVIARVRLTDRLDQGQRQKLTVISAPAGFGKTTLVGEWLERSPGVRARACWVALDPGDNDPGRFFTYFVRAIQTIEPGFGPGLINLMQSALSGDATIALVDLLNALNDLEERIILVLDDYHDIVNEEIHRALGYIIEHQPASLHIVIIARSTPPLSISRLRARREVNEFDHDDLRFTVEEATAFLHEVMRLDLTIEQVESLEQRTEGWIAALLLAALSVEDDLADGDPLASFGGEHRYVFDYLAEEVYRRQPAATRDFLTHTSILSRISAPLADELVSGENQKMLEHLVAANLFTIALDDQRIWFRYHHLFGEFLESRYRDQDPDGWVEAHIRASDWHERHGNPNEAIEHAITINDLNRLVRLLGRHSRDFIRRGQITTASRWLSKLPDDILASHPWLILEKIWTLLLSRQFVDVTDWFARVDFSTIEDGQERARIQAHYAVCEATYARFRGDANQIIERSLAAIERFRSQDRMDELDVSVAFLHLGSAQRMRGDTRASLDALARAIELASAREGRIVELNAHSQRSAAYGELGSLLEAESWANETLRREREYGLRRLAMAEAARITLAQILREREEFDEARALLRDAIDAIRATGDREDTGARILALYELSRIEIADDNHAEALRTIEEAVQLARDLDVDDTAHWRVLGLQAHINLLLGRIDAARVWSRLRDFPTENGIDYLNERATITRAWIEIEDRHLAAAGKLLTKLTTGLAEAGREYRLAEGRLVLAVVRHRQGRTRESDELVDHALQFAVNQNCRRMLIDSHPDVRELLGAAQERGIASGADWGPFLQNLLQSVEIQHGDPAPPTQSRLAEDLTPRELEVLVLLHEGISNREIAERLFVSTGTVKRHTHNIYGKLEVNNRTQAIVRAGEIGLLEGA